MGTTIDGMPGIGPTQSNFPEPAITSLTDNSGGTASDTIAAIGAMYSQSEVADAVASLAAKIEAILDVLRANEQIRT